MQTQKQIGAPGIGKRRPIGQRNVDIVRPGQEYLPALLRQQRRNVAGRLHARVTRLRRRVLPQGSQAAKVGELVLCERGQQVAAISAQGVLGVAAAQATIAFPKDIVSVTSVDKANSVFNFWLNEPAFSNDAGSITWRDQVLPFFISTSMTGDEIMCVV